MDTGRTYWGSEGKNVRHHLRCTFLPQGRAVPEVRPLWCPGPCLPQAYHRSCDGLLGHPPVGHHGSSRPEESERTEWVQAESEPFWNPPQRFYYNPGT